jgi:hypothetical protein
MSFVFPRAGLPLFAAIAAFLGVACGWSPTASAFCRKTTLGPADASYDPSSNDGDCGDAPGALPLFWRQSCIEYKVVVEPEVVAAGSITLERARAFAASAADAWTQAPCSRLKGGIRSPNIRVVDVDAGRCVAGGQIGPAAKANNEIRFTMKEPPPEKANVIADTNNLFSTTSGAMTDATMVIYNTTTFRAYVADPVGQEKNFAAVIRHEMGHVLGIAHSDSESAIMYAFYGTSPVPGLADNDIEAICDIYNPIAPIGDGCSVAPRLGPSLGATTGVNAVARSGLMPLALGLATFACLSARAVRRRARAIGQARTTRRLWRVRRRPASQAYL